MNIIVCSTTFTNRTHSNSDILCKKKNKMEDSSLTQEKNISVKKRCLDFFLKYRFPITVEPFAFFACLAFGLNEVNKTQYENIKKSVL